MGQGDIIGELGLIMMSEGQRRMTTVTVKEVRSGDEERSDELRRLICVILPMLTLP